MSVIVVLSGETNVVILALGLWTLKYPLGKQLWVTTVLMVFEVVQFPNPFQMVLVATNWALMGPEMLSPVIFAARERSSMMYEYRGWDEY